MDEVDEKSFDVRSILVLISHYHDTAVAQLPHRLGTCVFLLVLQTDDLDNVVDLRILHYLNITIPMYAKVLITIMQATTAKKNSEKMSVEYLPNQISYFKKK